MSDHINNLLESIEPKANFWNQVALLLQPDVQGNSRNSAKLQALIKTHNITWDDWKVRLASVLKKNLKQTAIMQIERMMLEFVGVSPTLRMQYDQFLMSFVDQWQQQRDSEGDYRKKIEEKKQLKQNYEKLVQVDGLALTNTIKANGVKIQQLKEYKHWLHENSKGLSEGSQELVKKNQAYCQQLKIKQNTLPEEIEGMYQGLIVSQKQLNQQSVEHNKQVLIEKNKIKYFADINDKSLIIIERKWCLMREVMEKDVCDLLISFAKKNGLSNDLAQEEAYFLRTFMRSAIKNVCIPINDWSLKNDNQLEQLADFYTKGLESKDYQLLESNVLFLQTINNDKDTEIPKFTSEKIAKQLSDYQGLILKVCERNPKLLKKIKAISDKILVLSSAENRGFMHCINDWIKAGFLAPEGIDTKEVIKSFFNKNAGSYCMEPVWFNSLKESAASMKVNNDNFIFYQAPYAESPEIVHSLLADFLNQKQLNQLPWEAFIMLVHALDQTGNPEALSKLSEEIGQQDVFKKLWPLLDIHEFNKVLPLIGSDALNLKDDFGRNPLHFYLNQLSWELSDANSRKFDALTQLIEKYPQWIDQKVVERKVGEKHCVVVPNLSQLVANERDWRVCIFQTAYQLLENIRGIENSKEGLKLKSQCQEIILANQIDIAGDLPNTKKSSMRI